jgi:hypothetical protein
MINSKVLDFCKDFLIELNENKLGLQKKGFLIEENLLDSKGGESHISKLNSLFSKTIKLQLGIQESYNNQKMLLQIGKSVEFSFLISKLSSIFYNYLNNKGINMNEVNVEELTSKIHSKTIDEQLYVAYDIFFFLMIVNDSTDTYREDMNLMTREE